MRKYYFLQLLIFVMTLNLQAQTTNDSIENKNEINCGTAVKDAEISYQNGEYNFCISSLQKALKDCSLSKTEKEEAWILIARSNIELDQTKDAENSMIKLLKNNPNYIPKGGAYQQDFYMYYNRISVRPTLMFGVELALNVPLFSVNQIYSILDGVDYSAPYSPKVGFSFGLRAEYIFIKDLSFATGLDYSFFNYKRNLTGTPNSYNAEYNESLNYFSLPFYVKKYFSSKSIQPFVTLGGNYNSLTKANADITLQYTAVDFLTGESDVFNTSTNGIDRIPSRKNNFWGVLIGAGGSYKYKNILIQLEARYTKGLSDFTNSDNKFINEELTYNYYYVDNATTLNRIELIGSINYIFMYDVKMKKHNHE